MWKSLCYIQLVIYRLVTKLETDFMTLDVKESMLHTARNLSSCDKTRDWFFTICVLTKSVIRNILCLVISTPHFRFWVVERNGRSPWNFAVHRFITRSAISFLNTILFGHLSWSKIYGTDIRPFVGGVMEIWTRLTLVVLVMSISACRTNCAHTRFCFGNCSYTAEQALFPICLGVFTCFTVLAR